MKDNSEIVQHLKDTGASFEEIEGFKKSMQDVENHNMISLEESKAYFLKYRSTLKSNTKGIHA